MNKEGQENQICICCFNAVGIIRHSRKLKYIMLTDAMLMPIKCLKNSLNFVFSVYIILSPRGFTSFS